MRFATGLSVLALALPAALPAGAPSVAPRGALLDSEVVCTVDDPRAVELSGLVATPEGYVSIVDSRSESDETVIVYLDQSCRVTRIDEYPTPPRDPEDLAVAPDGAIWVADIGDNITATERRATIALWRIPPEGGAPIIHRLTYPDGPHDAEALLFAADGSPIIITKELGATSYLYQATRALEPNTTQGVPMRQVGEFHPIYTSGPNDLGQLMESMVTGAATSPDRSRVALRTYTTAYEWDVPDGDVVKAITTTPPRTIPLPNEPQGEAIAYTVDGQALLTLSDVDGPTPIRRHPLSAAPSPSPTAPTVPTALGTVSAAPEPTDVGLLAAIAGLTILLATLAGLLVYRPGSDR